MTDTSGRSRFFAPAWCACWCILVLTVQPWSQGGSNAPKALALAVALGVTVLVLDVHARLRIPTAVWLLLVYAAILMTATLTFTSAGSLLIRWARFLASIAIAVLFNGRMRGNDIRLARWHLTAHAILGLSVLAGLLIYPSRAFAASVGDDSEGSRLVGVFLPLTAPRVGEVGAITLMLSFILWMFGHLHRWVALALILMSAILMVESGTRTAMLSMGLSLLVAFGATRRLPGGRRGLRVMLSLALVALLALPYVLSFVVRNQNTTMLFSLTGRTYTWSHIAAMHMTTQQRWFGHGLSEFEVLMRRSDNVYGLMPIDNGFVALYWMCGIVGVVLIAAFLLLVWVAVVRARPSANKAVALALVTYVSIACITEAGLGDLSSHTLHLLTALYLASSTRWTPLRSTTIFPTRTATALREEAFA